MLIERVTGIETTIDEMKTKWTHDREDALKKSMAFLEELRKKAIDFDITDAEDVRVLKSLIDFCTEQERAIHKLYFGQNVEIERESKK